jgi:hypothetical protein
LISLAVKLRERNLARRTIFAFPKNRDAVGIAVAVQAVIGDVQLAAGEPARPLHAFRCIQNFCVWSKPAYPHFLHHRRPELFQMRLRKPDKLLAARDAEALHES